MEYSIENDFLRITVASRGAELISVIKKSTGEEMMWTGDPEIWAKHAPVPFPYCGRLKNGTYTHEGISYEGGTHGFAWQMEHLLEEQTQDSITMKLEANVITMEQFPFAFQFINTYRLDGTTVHHEITVVNDDDMPLHFGTGYHPGFLCPFSTEYKTEDYAFVFDTPETPTVVEVSLQDGLVTGNKLPLFTEQTELPLTDTLFDNDSICMEGLQSKTLSLVEKPTGRKVTVDIAGFPYVLLWSKPGTVRFVCIEPWHTLPDMQTATGEWNEKPAIVITEGESWHTALALHFER